jgi:ubiquinone/menaquinone biosynthesis C-methylase UbiE
MSEFARSELIEIGYDAWLTNEYTGKCYTVHSDNFRIYLPSDIVFGRDEYENGNPYKFSFDDQFNLLRIDILKKMLCTKFDVTKKLSILDVGCGQGFLSKMLTEIFPFAEVIGLDYSINAVRYAAEHNKNIRFCVGDANNLPFEDNSFDVVCCANIWEHVPNPMLMLSEIKRVMKQSGGGVVTTPSRYRIENILLKLIGRPVCFISEYHIIEYSTGMMQEMLLSGGFKTVEMFKKRISIKSIKNAHHKLKYAIGILIFKPIFEVLFCLIRPKVCLDATVGYYFGEQNEG